MPKMHWGSGQVMQECDVVDAATREKLFTVSLLFVPRVGEDLDMEGGRNAPEGLYRIVEVRHHIKPPRLGGAGGLIGSSLYVERRELRP